jgi:RNA polymerase sigma-70 factor (ECF subfamily)
MSSLQKPAVTGAHLDPQAWLAEHGDALYRYARARVRDATAAEDLVQETLLAAWQARERYAGRAAERTWLIGILKNKLIDYLRRCNREQPFDPAADNDAEIEAMFEPDPSAHWRRPPSVWEQPAECLEQKEFWAVFADCLERLPPRQAQALTFTLIDGLPAEEVCKVLALASTNLWVLLHRARLRIRQCLEDQWFGKDGR